MDEFVNNFGWKQAWQIAVIFWGIPIIVFLAGAVWIKVYKKLKKLWAIP